jgi:hypothetical protein
MFSFVIRVNSTNRQMAVATTLVYDKMEEFRSLGFSDPMWGNTAGSETLVVAGQTYIRTWRIGADVPRTATVVVYARSNALTRRQTELLRATTLISPSF